MSEVGPEPSGAQSGGGGGRRLVGDLGHLGHLGQPWGPLQEHPSSRQGAGAAHRGPPRRHVRTLGPAVSYRPAWPHAPPRHPPMWEPDLWRRGAVNVLPPNLRGHRDSRVVAREGPTGLLGLVWPHFFSRETGLLLPLEKIFTLPRVGALPRCPCVPVRACARVHMWAWWQVGVSQTPSPGHTLGVSRPWSCWADGAGTRASGSPRQARAWVRVRRGPWV